MDQAFVDQLAKSRYLQRPLQADLSASAYQRYSQKPVLRSRALPLCDAFDRLTHYGPGTMAVCREQTVSGQGSICLATPTSTTVKNPTNRRYDVFGLRYPLDGEDLSGYNRLSAWVYLDAPGFSSQFVVVTLYNEGSHIEPVPGRFEGSHHHDVRPGAWARILWELPDIYRDKVTGISVGGFLTGSLPGCAQSIRLYVDDLRLEQVKPDKTRGFDLSRDAIAYCHSGYTTDARKQALVQHSIAAQFSLLDETGHIVYTGTPQPAAGGFTVLDFTPFRQAGRYRLAVGALTSQPFVIGPEAYLPAAWKTLNFFFSERCGFDVPTIHGECHLDSVCRHPNGHAVPIHGGWHDAADVSQSVDKTCDAILAMLDLAEATRNKEPTLADRALTEARWGLDWVMRTRFGDGWRHIYLIQGIWTENLYGDKDDMEATAQYTAFHNYVASYACGRAVPHFDWDPDFQARCLHCAIEDFDFAENIMDSTPDTSWESERLAIAVTTGAMLYHLTGEDRFLQATAVRARQLAQCQQQTVREDFAIPLSGYFYEDRRQTRPVVFYHRSTEQFYMDGYLRLLADAPNHPDAALWRGCVERYAGYLRAIARVMAPYGILPAGVYEVDNTDYSKFYHEGDAVGLPTLEEYNAQVRNGIPLNETHYLRRFPVAYQFRGFHTTLLSKAKNAFTVGRFLQDRQLFDIGARQLEYVLGFNPFAMSTMYGEGYDYPLLYGGFAGQPVGAVPVGIETFENDDEPYMPMQNNCTYKEIWVCSTARVMWSIAEVLRGL